MCKEKLLDILTKAIVQDPIAGIDINTAEESQNELAAEDNPFLETLKKELDNIGYGEEPRVIPLPGFKTLYISKVDDNIFSGFVRLEDPNSGEMGTTLLQLAKMTPISIVQALKAKDYLPQEEPKRPQEDLSVRLQSILQQYLQNQKAPEIHIHVEKSESIKKKVNISREYEVPYVAGYSKDGKTVYIDKRLPDSFKTKEGKEVFVDKYLMIHEQTEKELEDKQGLRYQEAHVKATKTERDAVESDGISWSEYDEFMQKWVKQIGTNFKEVPPDIDTQPERDRSDVKLLNKINMLKSLQGVLNDDTGRHRGD